MAEIPRKKSPRAPSMPLNEALDRAMKVYDRERLHAAPIEVIANNIGYKNANNGAALSAIASLRYFGLLERPKEGFLSVSKDVESFRFAPNDALRLALLKQFLKQPSLYAELLEQYASGLPSDANLRYELIQRGFMPTSADSALQAFKQSVAFAGYYDSPSMEDEPPGDTDPEPIEQRSPSSLPSSHAPLPTAPVQPGVRNVPVNAVPGIEEENLDRIPVRLPGGRRAWLLIPTPFFESDKLRLKAQIDLLLAEDEDGK